MNTTRVRLGKRSYNILIGKGLINTCGRTLKKLGIGTDAVIITNRRVASLYGSQLVNTLRKNGLSARIELVADSEKAKSLSTAGTLIDRLSRYDVRKSVFIIALGGGVVGDLAGFVASVYKRGVPYVQIPTTLLAQVDSSIGGKTAVDLKAGKNLAGSFYQPRAVISDVSLLGSLSRRQILCGLAEVIKYGIISDRPLFRYIESSREKILKRDGHALQHIVSRASKIKADIVAKDEFDRRSVRNVLNFGHTIGHAIEAASGYSGSYNHGEAVALGMVAACHISSSLGLLSESDKSRVRRLIKSVGLPVKLKGISARKIYEAHLHDKKFKGTINRFILATVIGKAGIVDGVADPVIRLALAELSGK